jgi:DNA-directed RNA polymerase subunit RPC12/RpoP
MKCPHCRRSVALFSRALNDFKSEKRCPYCGGKIAIYINFKVAALLLVPGLIVAVLLRHKLGIFGPGLAALAVAVLSMRLRSVSNGK